MFLLTSGAAITAWVVKTISQAETTSVTTQFTTDISQFLNTTNNNTNLSIQSEVDYEKTNSSIQDDSREEDIFMASTRGDVAAVKQLVKQDRGLASAQDAVGKTVLYHAAENNHSEIVQFLLLQGTVNLLVPL